MNVLHKMLIAFAMVASLTVAGSAQKDGQKKPPPKEKPPVVTPQPKPPPDNSNKVRKPGEAVALWKKGESAA
jgi:hypothetical protein